MLVVDDHPARRYANARLLAHAGFHILEAVSGRQPLALADAADAVLLDVHLPDIDGLEVCRRLRACEATAGLAIIHLSAVFVRGEDAERGRSAGADAYLIDPVPPEVLIQVIRSIMAERARVLAPASSLARDDSRPGCRGSIAVAYR